MSPCNSMRIEAAAVVRLAESIDADERSVESARLLTASRVFAGVVEMFLIHREQIKGETKR